jgi:hypothetical protein
MVFNNVGPTNIGVQGPVGRGVHTVVLSDGRVTVVDLLGNSSEDSDSDANSCSASEVGSGNPGIVISAGPGGVASVFGNGNSNIAVSGGGSASVAVSMRNGVFGSGNVFAGNVRFGD